MKLIFTIGLALGLALGAVTQASATTPSCQKTGNGHSCTVPGDSTVYNVATSSQATAIASVIAAQNQQQSQNQSQTSTNTNVNSNVATGGEGGNASVKIKTGDVYAPPAINGGAQHICYSMPTGGFCMPLKSAMIAARLDLMDRCEQKVGKWYVACIQSITRSPQIRKALIEAGLAK